MFDTKTLAPFAELLPALTKIDAEEAGALKADIERPVTLLSKGGTFRDRSGPELACSRAKRGDPGARTFALGMTDVTRGAYQRFAAATNRPARNAANRSVCSRDRRISAGARPDSRRTDDHPVVCVSWNDAKAYVDWLSQRTGEHYRLPTQREWLRRCAQPPARPRVAAPAISARTAAATATRTPRRSRAFRATRFGLFDVAGNVDVWTADCANGGSSGAGCGA